MTSTLLIKSTFELPFWQIQACQIKGKEREVKVKRDLVLFFLI